jgi:hypothetical protein
MEARGVRSLFALFVIRDRAGKTRINADGCRSESKNLTTDGTACELCWRSGIPSFAKTAKDGIHVLVS